MAGVIDIHALYPEKSEKGFGQSIRKRNILQTDERSRFIDHQPSAEDIDVGRQTRIIVDRIFRCPIGKLPDIHLIVSIDAAPVQCVSEGGLVT